ncbi:MAG: outer membrane beta-barrel protein [Gammaproteobacteria bacterium]|nr:outer membrane beta-barrel protein [Gammaproteobacteria bacterium]
MNAKKLWALGTAVSLVAPVLAQYQPPPYQPPPYQAPPPAYQQPPAYPPPPPPASKYQQSPSGSAASTHATSRPQGIQYHPWRVQIEGGYTITQSDSVKTLLNDGGNAGLGITWFPTAAIPLGFRVDGSYTSHPQTLHALDLASQSTGQNIADGYTDIYGGDLDAEIDLHLGVHSREYFFGGIGWYKERTTLKSVTYQQGNICGFFCYPGYYPVYSTALTSTTDWLKAWNAGIGFEFPLSDPATFFIDGRFLRIKQPQNGGYWDFIPIRVGIRF